MWLWAHSIYVTQFMLCMYSQDFRQLNSLSVCPFVQRSFAESERLLLERRHPDAVARVAPVHAERLASHSQGPAGRCARSHSLTRFKVFKWSNNQTNKQTQEKLCNKTFLMKMHPCTVKSCLLTDTFVETFDGTTTNLCIITIRTLNSFTITVPYLRDSCSCHFWTVWFYCTWNRQFL
jgi:hypothetical protein